MEGTMPVFKDTNQMYEVLGELWRTLLENPEFGPKLMDSGITIKYVMSEPDGHIWIGEDKLLLGNEADRDAIVTMELSGDTAHKFWLKQINLPTALASKKIKSKGPVPKVLKLLPLLKPAYEMYPGICDKYGIPKS